MTMVAALWAASVGCDGGAPSDPEPIPFEGDADPPICQDDTVTGIIDVHEHIIGEEGLDALLWVMDEAGVERTVAFSMLDRRYEDSLLLMAEAAGEDSLIPFTAVDVRDPAALGFLELSVNTGAAGLKLFSGHGEVHGETPLDSPQADPIYEYLESTGTPLLMHVNGDLYLDELERVLDAHPDLVMICPHFCLLTHDPGRLAQLLDDHPNLSVDISFGNPVSEVLGFKRLSEDIEQWRRFVRVYVDRIAFGSDTVFMNEASTAHNLSDLNSYLDFIALDRFTYQGNEYNGLGADPCTQKHLLQHNAERFISGLPPQRAP
jgi:predicted TIM-barrel fold metal-dependent hydrolase